MKIKYQFFTSVKIWYQFFTSVKNWYQFFISVSIWYWFFTFVKIEYRFFTGVKNFYQFFTFVKIVWKFHTFVKIVYQFFTSDKYWTSLSHMARMRTNSSQLKMRKMWNLSKDVRSPKLSKLTIRKFHIFQKWRIGTNSSHGVKFAKCEICGSTKPHKPLPNTFFSFGKTLICCVLVFKNTGTYTVALFYAKVSQVKICVCV